MDLCRSPPRSDPIFLAMADPSAVVAGPVSSASDSPTSSMSTPSDSSSEKANADAASSNNIAGAADAAGGARSAPLQEVEFKIVRDKSRMSDYLRTLYRRRGLSLGEPLVVKVKQRNAGIPLQVKDIKNAVFLLTKADPFRQQLTFGGVHTLVWEESLLGLQESIQLIPGSEIELKWLPKRNPLLALPRAVKKKEVKKA